MVHRLPLAQKKTPHKAGSGSVAMSGSLEVEALGLEVGANLGHEFGAEIIGVDLHDFANVAIDVERVGGELLTGGRLVERHDLLQLVGGEAHGIDARDLVEEIVALALVSIED